MSRQLKEVVNIARKAGTMLRNPHGLTVMEKAGHANYVTNADIEIQGFIKRQLLELLPGSLFIGEEQSNQLLTDEPSWIVDPIDGTTNFYRGWEFSAVSIALMEKGKPILACIYQPYKDEMFTAQKNKGAYLNHQRIHVSNVEFNRSLVGFGTSPYQPELAESGMRLALSFLQYTSDLRRSGSAVLDLAYVACGRQDVFFELNLSPWDVAAGALLVEEAGGAFQMPLCGGVQFERPAAVLATNKLCKDEAVKVFLTSAP